MSDFLTRLRDRKLVQWALAYGAAAFAMIQVLDIVAQHFAWPESTMRFVIVAVAIGFFITVVLAWYHGERGRQRVTGAELLILAVLLAIGGVVAWRLAPTMNEVRPTTAVEAKRPASSNATIDRKSIAVLPFESLSKDEDNAYFASGMQDMILTKLAGIGDMKVISRTSTEKYKSRPENLSIVGQELGVATILEGSVQKSGNDVLINVQLIDTATDNHLWAEAYPRTLDNVFGVEGEVAEKVAGALHSALTRDERATLAMKPTGNAAALQAYLKALMLEKEKNVSLSAVSDQLQTAVSLDPGFTLAWTELVWVKVRAYWFGIDATQENLNAAKAALDRAVGLAPTLPQVDIARAQYAYYAQRDFTGAIDLMKQVPRGLPNDARTWFFTAVIERRLGLWDDAIVHIQKALTLDPQDNPTRYDVVNTFIACRRFADALVFLESDSGADINLGALEMRLFIEWNIGGIDAAGKALSMLPSQESGFVSMRASQAFFQRDFDKASSLFATAIATSGGTSAEASQSEFFVAGYLPVSIGWQLRQALSDQRRGSSSSAMALFTDVQKKAQSALAKKQINLNVEAAWRAVLALADAGLGERDQAVAEAKRATELIPESKDAFEGPYWQDYLAQVYSLNGDATHAVPLIEHLLKTNGSLTTVALLKLDPVWDPIRQDAGFQALLK